MSALEARDNTFGFLDRIPRAFWRLVGRDPVDLCGIEHGRQKNMRAFQCICDFSKRTEVIFAIKVAARTRGLAERPIGACAVGNELIDNSYGTWVKVKLTQEQEFVIGSYNPPEGSRKYFGALLVGYYGQEGLYSLAESGPASPKKPWQP
jgi:hypothetical protein